MLNNKDITVIIPVHKYNESIDTMLCEAVDSVPKGMKIIISSFKGVDNAKCNGMLQKSPITWLYNEDGDTSFQNLVNKGVEACDTEWFSILEFDDCYTSIWFDNFFKYQEYNCEYNVFLPLVDLYDGKDNTKFLGYGNEAPWASMFSDKIGVIDSKSLSDYFDFYPNGGVFKKETWLEVGGLKTNIKLTFWYEFMLRLTNNMNGNIMVIPKVGYIHLLGREDSLIDFYRKSITKEESEFWFKTAKKEMFYKDMRDVNYIPKTEE